MSKLVAAGIKVLVQPSSQRIYSEVEFANAGAHITEDLSSACFIIGIKEVQEEFMLQNKTYFCFSHTFKRQPYNMPMLKQFISKQIRLVDYELVVDEKNDRLIAFGYHAGLAGTLDMLCGLGRYYHMRGYITPFFHAKPAYYFRNVDEIDAGLKAVTDEFSKLLHADLCPIVMAVLGNGRVASGVL